MDPPFLADITQIVPTNSLELIIFQFEVFFLSVKVVKLIGGRSVIYGAYPV